jgi:hypothetical protein
VGARRVAFLAVLTLAFIGWHLLGDFRVTASTRAWSVSAFVAIAAIALHLLLPRRT